MAAVSALDKLAALLAAVPAGSWEFDEPSNWLGISGLVRPVGSGDQVAVVSLAGWGKRKGRAIGEFIATSHNAMPALLEVARAARAVLDVHESWDARGELRLESATLAMGEALAALDKAVTP